MAEIEVVVIGDGVGDDTRQVVAGLRREDPRVRFLDLPKGPNHGEVHRGAAIEATGAEIVCYLCDDDLLLPDHVESMAGLLAEADLAHCQSGHMELDGSFHPYLADLELQRCREWVLRPDRNAVSLTGTAHTVTAYRRLPHGWRTTPPGRAPDHYMWQQFLAEPWVRAVTGTRATALQLPSHLEGRADWPAGKRRAELERWRDELATAVGRARFEQAVHRGVMVRATGEQLRRDEVEELLAAEKERSAAEAADLRARTATAEGALAAIESTRTWRLRTWLRRIGPLRALARATARRHPG